MATQRFYDGQPGPDIRRELNNLDGTVASAQAASTAALNTKVDKVAGKQLSTEDYTTAEKTKLAGVAAGAQVNTVTSVAGKTGAVTLAKADVGLGNVDNTADANKPVSTATQTALNGKEPTIAAGTVTQYWRGDKTWRDFFTDVRAATLTGLSTATNAVVTATDTVLAAIGKLQKQVSDNLATLTSHTGNTSNPHGVTKVQVGLGNVDNTSDANKPVSTAQANAIAARYGKNNVLGTVSQSAGVPTGAVIERGSNANGEYVRFADGTQICTISSYFTAAAEVVWSYPAIFVATPTYLSASINYPPAPRHYIVDTATTGGNISATIYRSIRETRAPADDPFPVCVMAIGRWF